VSTDKIQHASEVDLEQVLGIHHLDPNHKLRGLIESVLTSRGVRRDVEVKTYYWNAEFYGLDEVTLFTDLAQSRKEAVLHELSHGLLREACFIERFGFEYTSRLMLTSETIEEKSTFALMASDEARHLNGLLPFFERELGNTYTEEPLVMLLADVLSSDDRQALIFLLQAVLEGYGLFHYSHLMHGSNDAAFASALGKILKDEGFHHASGVAMLDESHMTRHTKTFLHDMVAQLVSVIQQNNGPLTVLERELGHLSSHQRQTILDQLHYDHRMAARMEKTRGLICEHAPTDLVQSLESKDLFKPMTSSQLVTIL
jgi:hypothetical protein